MSICLPKYLCYFQAANEVFKVIGYPWVVPWTAMTILQVRVFRNFEQDV